MDFVIIPSRRASFGLPQVKGRSWLGVLVLIQLAYGISYQAISYKSFRLSTDPFDCGKDCVAPLFVLFMDWFIASISILLPMITDELIFDDLVYFSFHYIYFVRLFLLYRVTLLTVLLPIAGVPRLGVALICAVHFLFILVLVRIFYVLLKEIEKSKNTLIAIQLTFRYLVVVSFVKVFRTIEGDSKAVAPCISAKGHGQSEMCPICFEGLSVTTQRNVTSASRTRVNISLARPLTHGKVNVFTTSCNHSFHRDCLMKWISGKPIKVELGIGSQFDESTEFMPDNRRPSASCPVCGRRIQLKIERISHYLFEFIWKQLF